MTVKMDAEAKAMIKLFNDWDSFNKEYIEKLAREMVKNQDHSPLTNRFQRKVRSQRTYKPLKDKTVKAKEKAKPRQRFVMQASGDTKRAVKRTIKGFVKGSDFILRARVPDYAADHNDGTGKGGKSNQRQFFSFNNKNGRPAKAEVNRFNSIAETLFNRILASRGLSVRR